MTAIGILVVAAGVALIWSGITDTPLLPELRAALGNPSPGGAAGTKAAPKAKAATT